MVCRTWTIVLAVGVLVAACSSGDEGRTAAPTEASGVQAQEAPRTALDQDLRDVVTVSGEGVTTGTPDVLRATIGVEVTEEEVRQALATANERAAAVITALEDAGVVPEDIQTSELTVRRERPHPGPEPPARAGPEERRTVVRNLVEARIRDVDQAGDILQGAVDAGGDVAHVRHVGFEFEDDDQLLDEARQRAFEDARRKAEQYAELAGRDLGPLVSLEEHPGRGGPVAPPVPDEAGGQAVPLEPGSSELTVRITAVWSLE